MKDQTPSVGKFANLHLYSDIQPYEIVRVVSDKTIEIRQMKSELAKDWKPEMVPGGFAAHTTNNRSQRWDIEPNPQESVVRARRRKDGYFHSIWGRHVIADEPRRFHDYNF